jgi:hypothetical protein
VTLSPHALQHQAGLPPAAQPPRRPAPGSRTQIKKRMDEILAEYGLAVDPNYGVSPIRGVTRKGAHRALSLRLRAGDAAPKLFEALATRLEAALADPTTGRQPLMAKFGNAGSVISFSLGNGHFCGPEFPVERRGMEISEVTRLRLLAQAVREQKPFAEVVAADATLRAKPDRTKGSGGAGGAGAGASGTGGGGGARDGGAGGGAAGGAGKRSRDAAREPDQDPKARCILGGTPMQQARVPSGPQAAAGAWHIWQSRAAAGRQGVYANATRGLLV